MNTSIISLSPKVLRIAILTINFYLFSIFARDIYLVQIEITSEKTEGKMLYISHFCILLI